VDKFHADDVFLAENSTSEEIGKMGGGGGGSSSSLGDTSHLEDRAKEILQSGDTGRKNVFISFAHEDLNEVTLLRGQAKNENSEIEFNDFSVKEPYQSERAEYIRQKIRERINQSSITVVYLSAGTAKSDWVKWEIEKSIELGKQVIATHSGDKPAAPIPEFITDNKIRVVPWSGLGAEMKKR
jgi:hypothetical protein